MEIGRTTTCRVSAYTRNRVHQSRLIAGETPVLSADFNGALDPGVTIAAARWRLDVGYVASIASPTISTDKRSTSLTLFAVWVGCTMILCEATMSNGDKLTQMFEVDISGNPYFLPSTTSTGSMDLTVTA